MTDFQKFRERTRDQQDFAERMVWGSLEYVDGAGAVLKARGTRTVDEEMPVANFGYGFNVPQDYNTEVFALSHGSDTTQKYAIPTIPRDKQRQWPENTGGVQNPVDASKYIEFNGDEIHLKDGKFVIGNNREMTLEISGGTATLTMGGNLVIAADNVDIQSSTLTHNGTNVGDDHRHTGVVPGGALTGEPA